MNAKQNWQNYQLSSLIDYKNGLWTGKNPPYINAKVIRATEFNDDGSCNLDTAKEIKVEVKQLENKRLQMGDIVLERSGGGENKPVGRVVYIPKEVSSNNYTFSNFTTCLRPKANIVDNKYLLYFLYLFYISGNTKLLQKAVIGIRNLEFSKYLLTDVPIPILNGKPNLEEQKRIVNKIDKVVNIIEKSKLELNHVEDLIRSLCISYFNKADNNSEFLIGNVCEIKKGSFPILKTPAGKYPLVVTAEERKTANDYQFDDEAVCIPLVSSTGHGHASLKRIHYQEGKFALANIMVALISKDKSKILPKYLYYYLSFYKDKLLVSLMRGGANVTIPLKEISNVKISVPDIKKQRKFIAIINNIEQLKEKSKKRVGLNEKLFELILNYAYQDKL